MFCPSCGVKNEGVPLKCFVCGRILPQGEGESRRESRPRIIRRLAPTTSFAAIGDRMLALLLDRIFLAAILGAAVIGVVLRWPAFAERVASTPWLAITAGVAAILLILGYHIALEGAFGATLGKAILGLHVRTDSDGNAYAGAALRNGLRLVDAIGVYAIAFLVSVFSQRKQRLGDHLSHSFVVVERVHPAARAGLIFLWAAVVGGFAAYAVLACPQCGPDLAGRIADVLVAASSDPRVAGR